MDMSPNNKCGYISCNNVDKIKLQSCHYCQKKGCDECIFNNAWVRDNEGLWQCELCQSWKYRRYAIQNTLKEYQILKRA